jgi:hypothetical protein
MARRGRGPTLDTTGRANLTEGRRITMKALGYLLGARAIDIAMQSDQRRSPSEPPFLPIASTPDRASAWRRWAAEARAAGGNGEPVSGARKATTTPQATSRAARGDGAA